MWELHGRYRLLLVVIVLHVHQVVFPALLVALLVGGCRGLGRALSPPHLLLHQVVAGGQVVEPFHLHRLFVKIIKSL